MNAAYSDLKAAWHLDKIEDLRQGKQIIPVELQLILSDACQHSCSWCAYRAEDGLSSEQFVVMEDDGKRNTNPKRMIGYDKAREILNDCATLGIKSVIFTGGGDPTYHPRHMDLFSEALSLGLDCSLNTNGNTLARSWESVLPKFAYVRFSVDAGTAEEHARTRSISESAYPKILSNLARLAGEVDRQGSPCVVGTGYVVTSETYLNLDSGVRNIKATGAQYVRLASMQSKIGKAAYPGDTYASARRACADAVTKFSDDKFSVVDLFDERQGERPDYDFCGMQQFVLYLGGNLKLYRCCYNAYTDFGEIGDLSDKSLASWMFSPEKIAAIGTFDARSCTTCPLSAKNRTINYMRDPSPMHVNFV